MAKGNHPRWKQYTNYQILQRKNVYNWVALRLFIKVWIK